MIRLNNYLVQQDLYEFMRKPLAMGVDTIKNQIYLTRRANSSEEIFYPYDDMDSAVEDFQAIKKIRKKLTI